MVMRTFAISPLQILIPFKFDLNVLCFHLPQLSFVPNCNHFYFSILKYGRTPLIKAAKKVHTAVVQMLLSAGANTEATDKVILMINNCMAV